MEAMRLKLADNNNTHLKEDFIEIGGLDCPDCAATLEKSVRSLAGVKDATLSFATSSLSVIFDEAHISEDEILKLIGASGYTAKVRDMTSMASGLPEPSSASPKTFWLSDPRARSVAISAIPLVAAAIIEYFAAMNPISIALFLLSIVIAGRRTYKSSFTSLRMRVFDMNVLMMISVIGAIAISQWAEAATVMFLLALGSVLESYSLDKTRNSIRELISFAPKNAAVKQGDSIVVKPVESVNVGDVVVVKPGERISIDGEIVSGSSAVNQSEVTGESMPVTKIPGDTVYAGTLNYDGYLEIKATKLAKDTTIAKIVYMVEEAQSRKASSQQFIDKFSTYYTPSVICLALVIAVLPPLFGQPFVEWFYRALVLLVIACPCALVISTPVSIVSAIGAATKNGVLIKGGSYLEAMGRVNTIVFDKTGTLTTGKLAVTDVIPFNDHNDDFVLRIAAALESKSLHPLAEAVTSHARHQRISLPETNDFKSLPGLGLEANIDGDKYYAGNLQLFSNLDVLDELTEYTVKAMQGEGKTVFLIGTARRLIGVIAVADKLRENAKNAIGDLKHSGIDNIVMLTGDNKETASEIAAHLGIDKFEANLLPDDKLARIESISDNFGRTAMVGDGVNDAPAISRADVGIAMGAIGSDIAIETADIALMGDDLEALPYTVKLSRKTLRIIKQNVTASIAVKLAFITLSVFGLSTLWMAVFADTGIALLVILNGLRLYSRHSRYSRYSPHSQQERPVTA
jgi:Cd2+/Zn2+-exporting ATPase